MKLNSLLSGSLVVLALLIALSFAPTYAKDKRMPSQLEEDINDHLKPIVDDNRFSGNVLVAKGDEVLVNKGYGDANREWSIKNRKRDRFRIASLTKAMLASATLSLRDSNQLTLDDTVGQYLNDYPIAVNVTIKQLIGHTSVIPDYVQFPDFPVFQRQSFNTSNLIDVFRDMPLEFAPGTQASFSNSGYIVLTAILETVTGKDVATLLKDLVIDPIDLKYTQLDNEDLLIEQRVSGYLRIADPTNPRT